ncbi:hypothetical protein [Aminipila terrae]|uniref:Uncharacterized protein n=1 Tax=Aminipila terrae TaxID=2697030 RepID=A0A6P1MMK1_9FIRM|nr:hypothetical protein [Aminipila terrae]QHI72886.1 hypothetical protein Ami3637_11135 [Aminipila terrae]
MKQPLPPCNGCSTREPACQDKCENYQEYRKRYAKYQAMVQAEKNKQRDIDDFKYQQVTYCKGLAGR